MLNGADIVVHRPIGTEDIERFGEHVVVNQTGVHGEKAHEENYITTAEENIPDLVVTLLRRQRFLLQHHPTAKQKHDETVTGISEHNRKQERERNDSIGRGIHFTVGGNPISVDKRLEAFRKFVCAIIRRWIFESFHAIQYRRYRTPTAFLKMIKRICDVDFSFNITKN